MIINSSLNETIKINLQRLDEVCEKYPILKSYRDGGDRSNISGLGLDNWINFIDYLKLNQRYDIKPYYDEPITYKFLRKKLVEISKTDKAVKAFSKKTEDDFLLILTDYSKLKRYTRTYNQSYFSGLFNGQSLILSYLIQKINDPNTNKIGNQSIRVDNDGKGNDLRGINIGDTIFTYNTYYTRLIPLPTFRNLEFDMVDNFINSLEKSLGDFDFRKCNLNLIRNKVTDFISRKFYIESGSSVKAMEDIYDSQGNILIKKGEVHPIVSSNSNYDGFLYITINIKGKNTQFPYSKFEEISRMRDDILNELFGDSGS